MPTVLTLSNAALLFLVFVLSPVVLAVLPPMREPAPAPKRPASPVIRPRAQVALRPAQASYLPGLLPLAAHRRRPATRLS